jgi:hypothetical protein
MHSADSVLDDPRRGAAPACVEGCHYFVADICYQDWNAVRRSDAQHDSGQSSDEPIAFEHGLAIGGCQLSFERSVLGANCVNYR